MNLKPISMKKLFLGTLLFVSGYTALQAQNPALSTGSWFLEGNTRLTTALEDVTNVPITGFGLIATEDLTIFSIGGEAGYFVADNLALKGGLGLRRLRFNAENNFTIFTYRFGARYYLKDIIPLQIDISGSSQEDTNENALWLGLQGGYAFFVTERLSIEPALRYYVSLNEDFSDQGIFEIRIGAQFFFIAE